MAFKGRRFNDVTMIQVKLQDTLANCLAVHVTKCFGWWHGCWAQCVNSQGDQFAGAALIRRCCLGEINLVQKLFDDNMHHPLCSLAETWTLSRPGI